MLHPDAIAALLAYSWPGNVRELKNVLLRAAATAPLPRIMAEDLVLGMGTPDPPAGAAAKEGGPPRVAILDLDRGALVKALDSYTWNFRRTAHQLGISRMTLYRWMQRYGITRDEGPD